MLTPPRGKGTFSSVYKAIDLNHYAYDNHPWAGGDDAMLPVGVPRKKVYVALKRIYVTSSPQRILNELELMEELRCVPSPQTNAHLALTQQRSDCANIAYLITAFRTEDQIVAVMPYSRHRDFRVRWQSIVRPLSVAHSLRSAGVLPHLPAAGHALLLPLPLPRA
jgi:cell division control protein 7